MTDSIDEAKEREAAYDAWARVSYEEAPDPIDAYVDGWLARARATQGEAVGFTILDATGAKPYAHDVYFQREDAERWAAKYNLVGSGRNRPCCVVPLYATPPPSPQGRGEPTAKACPRCEGGGLIILADVPGEGRICGGRCPCGARIGQPRHDATGSGGSTPPSSPQL